MKKTLEEEQAAMKARNTRWKPGQSGNPEGGGRPRLPLPKAAAPEVQRQLATVDEKDPRKRTNFERIVTAQIEIAKNWKAPNAASRAYECLMDRAFGKPIQQIDQNLTVTSREQDLEFLKEQLGLKDHGSSSESIQ